MNYYTMKKQLDDLIKLTIKPAIWEDIIGDDDCAIRMLVARVAW